MQIQIPKTYLAFHNSLGLELLQHRRSRLLIPEPGLARHKPAGSPCPQLRHRLAADAAERVFAIEYASVCVLWQITVCFLSVLPQISCCSHDGFLLCHELLPSPKQKRVPIAGTKPESIAGAERQLLAVKGKLNFSAGNNFGCPENFLGTWVSQTTVICGLGDVNFLRRKKGGNYRFFANLWPENV